MTTNAHAVEPAIVTPEEGAKMLDRAAFRWLNLSGQAFLLKWDRGDFADDDRLAVQQVAAMIDFARA